MKLLFKSIPLATIALTAAFSSLSSSVEAASLSTLRASGYQRQPGYVTVGDPDDYIVSPGTGFDGVVDLVLDTDEGFFGCTGSLLTSGRHILTAAHCLTDLFGANITNAARVFFDLPTGTVTIDALDFFIFPDWDGFADFESFGGDIAILELESEAPETAERYDIYRDTDEVGQVGVKVGYGLTGTGNQGSVINDFATKRSGQNLYDAPGEILSLIPESFGIILPDAFLSYDFDNGLAANDAFGFFFDIPDLGLGFDEVLSAPGDSGGPTFINGLIAGVTSFGGCVGDESGNCSGSDIDTRINSSFGEFGGDTRVSTYASWVDSIVGTQPPAEVPEPGTLGALLLTSFAAVRYCRRTDKSS